MEMLLETLAWLFRLFSQSEGQNYICTRVGLSGMNYHTYSSRSPVYIAGMAQLGLVCAALLPSPFSPGTIDSTSLGTYGVFFIDANNSVLASKTEVVAKRHTRSHRSRDDCHGYVLRCYYHFDNLGINSHQVQKAEWVRRPSRSA